MENHPIPQDIQGFQFKLIGQMTVKQFAYLATGVVIGWVFGFILPLPFLVKWPIALLAAGTGAGFAFVPIEGRPMDTMVFTFINTLLKPNQYLYNKEENQLSLLYQTATAATAKKEVKEQHVAPRYSEEQLESYLQSLPHQAKSNLDEKEMVFFNSVSAYAQGKTPPPQPKTEPKVVKTEAPVVAEQPKEEKEKPKEEEKPEEIDTKLVQEEEILKQELAKAKAEETAKQTQQEAKASHEKVSSLEQELQEVENQRRQLEEQLLRLQKKLADQQKDTGAVYTPSIAEPKSTQSVVAIPKTMSKAAGMPFVPDVPNVLVGIIKDPRNNPLPNMLVEVKDKDGNPVRAFKTNGLGQFASATPLVDGIYTLDFEDPAGKHRFEKVQIIANGEVLMPLEVHSVDDREELRRWLFSGQAGGPS